MGFTTNDIPDLKGKVAIITGANTGIGKVSALEMARKGCHVILACRSKEKALAAAEEIVKATGNQNVEFMELDLTSLASISKFSEEFKSKNLPLHILLNNAGIMLTPFQLTKDGLESQFGTNHVGHFYLTTLLLDDLEKSQPSRIVCLSSMAHRYPYQEGIIFDQINDPSVYNSGKAYGQSKLCNALFGIELARRLQGKEIYVNVVHPGWVATELQRNVASVWGSFASSIASFAQSLFALSPEKGALTQLYAATHPEIEQKKIVGKYFVPIAKEEVPSEMARDPQLAKRLWEFTEAILKEKLKEAYVSRL